MKGSSASRLLTFAASGLLASSVSTTAGAAIIRGDFSGEVRFAGAPFSGAVGSTFTGYYEYDDTTAALGSPPRPFGGTAYAAKYFVIDGASVGPSPIVVIADNFDGRYDTLWVLTGATGRPGLQLAGPTDLWTGESLSVLNGLSLSDFSAEGGFFNVVSREGTRDGSILAWSQSPVGVGPGPTVLPGYQIDRYLTGVGATTGVTIAPDGSLWVADYQGGRLLRSTTQNAFRVVVSGIPSIEGVAFTESGRVFAASSTGPSSTIYEIINGVAQPFATGFSYPTSIAAKGNELFVTNSGNGTIAKISMTGVVQQVLAAVGNPFGVSFDPTGKMYFIDHAGGVVYSYDFAAPPVGVSPVTPYGGTFTSQGFDGRLFFTDAEAGSLYWLSSGGSKTVFGSGFAGNKSPPVVGPQGLAFDGQRILYVGDGNSVWRITSLAPTTSLSANPSSLTAGASSTLIWSSTNTTSCMASGGWTGARPTSGSESTGVLDTTTDFTLTCTGSGGNAARTVTVTVTPPPSPTVSFSASPSSISAGAASTLTWSSSNATSCAASGGWSGVLAASGSASTGALSATTNFTVTCTGPGGSGSQAVTVSVTPPPAPKKSGGGGAMDFALLTLMLCGSVSCSLRSRWRTRSIE